MEEFRRFSGVILPDSLDRIQEYSAFIMQNHEAEWTEFKCRTIAGYVGEIVETLDGKDPELKYNLHYVPWTEEDYDGAIRRVAGQDLDLLAPLVDYISPMCYTHMLKRDPEWVHDVVNYFSIFNEDKILPSIQVEQAYRREKFSPEAFEKAFQAAIEPPSRGVIFWSWEALNKNEQKKEIVKTASLINNIQLMKSSGRVSGKGDIMF